MNKKNIGFTLIELLVVIAIIGILSGLIIVSLGDATNQAKEAKIKSALDQLRPVAQLHYNKYGDYTTTTTLAQDTKVVNIFNDIVDNGGTAIGTGLSNSSTLWCAYSSTPTGGCMCVDGEGKTKTSSTSTSACNCSSYKCPN